MASYRDLTWDRRDDCSEAEEERKDVGLERRGRREGKRAERGGRLETSEGSVDETVGGVGSAGVLDG